MHDFMGSHQDLSPTINMPKTFYKLDQQSIFATPAIPEHLIVAPYPNSFINPAAIFKSSIFCPSVNQSSKVAN